MPAVPHCARVHLPAHEDSAAHLFGRLHQRWPEAPAAFLDSSDHASSSSATRSRYSVLAFALGSDAVCADLKSGAWEWIARQWSVRGTARSSPGSGRPPFQLGQVGYIGYEGQGRFFRATHAVVVDHHTGVAELQSERPDPSWQEAVCEEAATLAERGMPPVGGAGQLSDLRVRDGQAAYRAKVAEAQQQIREGNSYEVCLTTAVTGRYTGGPWEAYLQLRAANRAPFTQYLNLPAAAGPLAILSSSPERYVQMTESGRMQAEPIKGTRPRGDTAQADVDLLADLQSHPKDRAENVMITDLVRNDLSVCAVPGTLRTERLCAVETYPTVHQMVSTVSAQLAPETDRATALAAAFPPGSMTGAPKLSTMEILSHLEGHPRGAYSGVAGYFSTTGACDLSVLIRTAVLTRRNQPGSSQTQPGAASGPDQWNFHLGLGGAITADSHPEAEWEEVMTKSRGVLGALQAEFPAR